MAYTFRIHKGTPALEDGWQKSVELAGGSNQKTGVGSIDDSIEGGNAGKVGTSIPTPFARIYLFDTAFKFVTDNKSRKKSFYDQLVTQSLDLLQFIFEKGKDKDLKIHEWDGKSQVDKLVTHGFKEGHKALANSLNMSINSNEDLKTIYLIEYKGIILGGTSPFTLVYTSPNAIRQLREIKEKNEELLANDRSPLFKQNNIRHLNERSKEFQRYVLWLVKISNNKEFTYDKSPLHTFYDYVMSQNIGITDSELNEVPERYYKKTDIKIGLGQSDNPVSLRVNEEPVNMDDSDFIMRPSIHCFDGPVPLILPTDGDSMYDGWQYFKNERWQSLTRVYDHEMIDSEVEDRFLPTNGVNKYVPTTNKYPWLTTCDLFQSSLVVLGYDLNIDKFYFPSTGEIKPQFLLPIKKEYFKYFRLEDLKNNLTCEIECDSKKDKKIIIAVKFELTLKLQNKESITLKRTYTSPRHGERPDYAIVEYSEGMSFGVFPFYRCDSDIENEYSVYLYGSASDDGFAKLKFYRQDIDENKLEIVLDTAGDEGEIRTKTSDIGYSRLYNLRNEVNNSFDIIEVEMCDKVNAGCGLAIPLWITPPLSDTNKEAIVSIDFGTSNTYVSYLENNNPLPLTIGEDDQQMVLLNAWSKKQGTNKKQYREKTDFGDAQYMNQFLREFVPSIIGHPEEISDDEFIEFPIKTATIEKQNFKAEDSLFSGISIGFNIDNEKHAVEAARFHYVTDLKWSAEEHRGKQNQGNNLAEFNKDRCRIQAFCDQTLWMIKNLLVLKGYSKNVKMIYFYPDSMSLVGRDIFKTCWKNSVKSIFEKRGFQVRVNEELEAISPYYSLLVLKGDKFSSKSTANIDIGGGTSDYFILDQSQHRIGSDSVESGKAYEASIFYAGNDLWGATYPASTQPAKFQENGFVKYMKDNVKNCRPEAQKLFDYYDKEKGMADFSGFFFKNDRLFEFSDKISNHEKFRFVVFLHYASLIYHFADMLKVIKKEEPDFKYPEILTFTGKGSEYTNMISKSPKHLSVITTELIQSFGIPDFKGIEVIRVNNPKALTADGGVYKLMTNSELQINLVSEEKFGQFDSDEDESENSKIKTPYKRIGKKCVGVGPYQDGKAYTKGDVIELKEKAMAHVKEFADAVFNGKELAETRKFLKFNLKDEDYDKFLEFAEASYETHSARYFNTNAASLSEPLEESIFFFAMKNTLINLSIYYYNNNNK